MPTFDPKMIAVLKAAVALAKYPETDVAIPRRDVEALLAEVERLQAALASEEAEVRSLAERGMARGAELDEARTKLSALSVVNETLRAELRSVRPSREAARRATVDEARLAWAASVRGDGEEAVPAQVLAAARDALSDLADMTPAGEVQALLARALAALDGPA